MASFNLSDPTEQLARLPENRTRPPTDPLGLMVYLGRDMVGLPGDMARVSRQMMTDSPMADLLRQALRNPPSGPMPKVLTPASIGSGGKGGAIR